jgi:hypothetical protein
VVTRLRAASRGWSGRALLGGEHHLSRRRPLTGGHGVLQGNFDAISVLLVLLRHQLV